MLSVQAALVACTLGLLPPEQQAAVLAALGVPPERLPVALGVLFLVTRLLNQRSVSEPPLPAAPVQISENDGPSPARTPSREI